MAISALYILDSQGNRLIFRDYRGDVDHRDAMEEFVKNLNEEEDSARKPVFEKDGLSFIYIRKNNIYRTDPSVCRFFLQFLVAAFSSRPLCLGMKYCLKSSRSLTCPSCSRCCDQLQHRRHRQRDVVVQHCEGMPSNVMF
jgi:hypothetical protein